MQTIKQPLMTEHHWNDVRDQVHAINLNLACIIDSCAPGSQALFTKVSLDYGEHLFNAGQLQLSHPKQAAHFPSSSATFCALVLGGSVESFHQFGDRIAPITCYEPGQIMGLDNHTLITKKYAVPQSLQMTSGARSIFMLPKITDSASHRNVQREFHFRLSTPKKLTQHWDIFRLLAQHADPASKWQSQSLVLPTTLLDPNNAQALPLQHYLSQTAHRQHEYWRHQYLWDLTFSRIKSQRNLKPNPYLADTCKHLFAIGVGAVPGFTAAHDDSLAPIDLLQKIYLDVYGLKHYAPVLMQPQKYCYLDNRQSVYYSLQLPTLLEFSPKSRNLSSTISDLREVKHITATYISELQKSDLGIDNTPIQAYSTAAQFSFYHSEDDVYGEILNSQLMLMQDPALNAAHSHFHEQGFSENSPFVRGCIQISSSKSNDT